MSELEVSTNRHLLTYF